jgi:CBS domain-containing protein
MPVVDGDGVLVGMVSRSDVIRVLATADDQIRRRIAHDYAQLTDRQWTVEVTDGLVTVRGVTSERDGRLASAIAATAPGVRRVVVDASTLGAPLSP